MTDQHSPSSDNDSQHSEDAAVDATAVGALDDDATAHDGEPDEGDIAADYIEELLDIADLDGDIEIDVRAGRTYLTVGTGAEGDLRVLAEPNTVDALQELTRLAVQARTGDFSRLILDVAGSRDARAAELERLVARAIERIEAGAESAALPPMSSYERKLVHDFAGAQGFASESQGEGRDRHNVIRRA